MIIVTIKNENGDFVNALTEEMDKYIIYPIKGFVTYLWYETKKLEDGKGYGRAIRYPGATRGHIEVNKDGIITGIVLYETASDNCIACYSQGVHEAVLNFIGCKIVYEE
jgi:hypothetical protein